MKIINSHNVYTYVLNELEWYAVDASARSWTIENCLDAARKSGCAYAAIIVEPDALMSVSPVPHRHRVWNHTFETDAHEVFRRALLDAYEDAKLSLSAPQIASIARDVFQ